jgi:uncharacterized SAM-binding protein YcdF (DUF218 family)
VIRRLFKLALLLVGLVVLYLGVTFAQVWWESKQDNRAPASAIVVLGAAQYDGVPSPVLKARLDHAAELYQQGVAKTIVVTGGKQAGDRTGEGLTSYAYLKSKGVPESALKVEVAGTDTYDELSSTALILDEAKLGHSVVIVSSPYHAYRASAIAEEVGLQPHFSASADESPSGALVRETGAAAIGRIIGYRRLSNLL